MFTKRKPARIRKQHKTDERSRAASAPLPAEDRTLAGRVGVRVTVLDRSTWLFHHAKKGHSLGQWNPRTGFLTLQCERCTNCRRFAEVVEVMKIRLPDELHPRTFGSAIAGKA